MPVKRKDAEEQSKQTRIAVLNPDRCKPKKCSLECKRCCPINQQGKLCIQVSATDKMANISEELCIGCGLCVKRCPYHAIDIINLPSNLDAQVTHRYGPNSFKLHRLPLPRPGQVLGLIGANGTGKSTALNILKGRIIPNLGRHANPPAWTEILKYFRGSEHQAYFEKLCEQKIQTELKPQFVDEIPKRVKGKVGDILRQRDDRNMLDHYIDVLDLRHKLDSDIVTLSGGELQRLTIALVCVKKATVYMFDEPSSYLDVRQRMTAAATIRKLLSSETYVITVEHDLSVMDYMSDYCSVLYGRPNTYGVVTLPYSVREGINIFLEGFVPTENLRFREEKLDFRLAAEEDEGQSKKAAMFTYPSMVKQFPGFKLTVEGGSFSDSEIIVLLGENGCGKTTLIRMLAGFEKSDNGAQVTQLTVSYKPQQIAPKFQGTVKDLLQTKILDAFNHPQFVTDVLKPLNIDELLDVEVPHLSGGQRQRVALTLCLGIPAQVYLIDEPSAYLDSDQRIIAARVIKRYIMHVKKTAFVVEHDFIMATYLADRVVVYDGVPGVDSRAGTPTTLMEGMNKFLSSLAITFRRDPDNGRPRVNKLDSVKDRMQKESHNYFYMNEPNDKDKKAKGKNKTKGVAGDDDDDDDDDTPVPPPPTAPAAKEGKKEKK